MPSRLYIVLTTAATVVVALVILGLPDRMLGTSGESHAISQMPD